MNLQDNEKTIKSKAVLFVKGFCMGVCDLIPGISGGTMALILGIYERLINSIRSIDMVFVKNIFSLKVKKAFENIEWKFLLTLFSGIIFAILSLSHLIEWLLTEHTILIMSFFFGLVAAAVPLLMKMVKKWNVLTVVLAIVATFGAHYVVSLTPVETSESAWFIFISGAIAICAMILPGISGSFILLLLGKYEFILSAVNQRDFGVIIIFVLGIVCGILSFVRVLSWLFHRYHDQTVAVLAGIVFGSLSKIWPWKEIVETITTSKGEIIVVKAINVFPLLKETVDFWGLGLIVIGFVICLFFNRRGTNNSLNF